MVQLTHCKHTGINRLKRISVSNSVQVRIYFLRFKNLSRSVFPETLYDFNLTSLLLQVKISP